MLTIDGSVLEGVMRIQKQTLKFKRNCTSLQGGQIVRMAIAFSALTKKSIKIIKIRAARTKGGLALQHLKGARTQEKPSETPLKWWIIILLIIMILFFQCSFVRHSTGTTNMRRECDRTASWLN